MDYRLLRVSVTAGNQTSKPIYQTGLAILLPIQTSMSFLYLCFVKHLSFFERQLFKG